MATIRDVIGDDLFLSISQVKAYLKCPRQFEFRYVRGAAPEFVPMALAFGVAFHGALARYYAGRRDGAEVTVEEVIQTFSDLWTQKKAGPLRIQGDDEEDGRVDPVDLAAKMLRAFHAQASQTPTDVVAIEQPFGVTLFEPDTGEVVEEKLVGVIDLVVREQGQLVVVEHKSSNRKYSADQLVYDLQPTAYQLAMKEAGHDEVGLRYQVVTKTKVPAVQIEKVTRTASDEDDFHRTALGVLKAIDSGVFYPVRGWQCRTCPFKSACSARTQASASNVVRLSLIEERHAA